MKLGIALIAAAGTICFPPPPDSEKYGPDLAVYVQPQYPSAALAKCMEGWVKFRLYVGHDGSVAFATILDSEPEGVFEENASRAVYRWKYLTRTADGPAIDSEHVVKIVFDPDEYFAPDECVPKTGT